MYGTKEKSFRKKQQKVKFFHSASLISNKKIKKRNTTIYMLIFRNKREIK